MTCKEFIKSRLSHSSMLDLDLSDAYVYNGQRELDELLDNKSSTGLKLTGKDINEEEIKINIDVIYDPTAEFDYFTYTSICHDGTLLFVKEAIDKCLIKVLECKTYDNRKTPPSNKCSVRYTIGDFVVLNEYGEQFSTQEKPWMRSRTLVFLPIKYEYIS